MTIEQNLTRIADSLEGILRVLASNTPEVAKPTTSAPAVEAKSKADPAPVEEAKSKADPAPVEDVVAPVPPVSKEELTVLMGSITRNAPVAQGFEIIRGIFGNFNATKLSDLDPRHYHSVKLALIAAGAKHE